MGVCSVPIAVCKLGHRVRKISSVTLRFTALVSCLERNLEINTPSSSSRESLQHSFCVNSLLFVFLIRFGRIWILTHFFSIIHPEELENKQRNSYPKGRMQSGRPKRYEPSIFRIKFTRVSIGCVLYKILAISAIQATSPPLHVQVKSHHAFATCHFWPHCYSLDLSLTSQ